MPKKILLVDDEKNIRDLYAAELEDEGYTVTAASSGEEALGILDTLTPDLITLDIRMPGMGGIEALREIREKFPTVPVIMLTAYPEYKADFDVWAADAYIVKSSDTTQLKEKTAFLTGGPKG
jgi:CheY-like chemotaxis protein